MGEAGDTATAFAIGMFCIIAVLLGALHRQHDLVDRTYDITALSFAISASVALFPTPYWVESPALYRVLHITYVIVTVLATSALVWLARRKWRLRSKLRIVLAVGVGLVALRFATSLYEATYDPPMGLEEVSGSLFFFMIDSVIARAFPCPKRRPLAAIARDERGAKLSARA